MEKITANREELIKIIKVSLEKYNKEYEAAFVELER